MYHVLLISLYFQFNIIFNDLLLMKIEYEM